MNIIVTGASKGIGKEIAKSFASERVKNLFLVARNRELLEVVKKDCLKINNTLNIVLIASDLKDLLENKDVVHDLFKVDKIDVIINNAGYLVRKPFREISDKEITQMFTVNTFLPVKLVKVFLKKLINAGNSHVVNIGSMGGFQGSSKFPGLSFYSASKAALACMTECLAIECSEFNIKFNCLALGAVQTEMLGEAFPGYMAPVTPQEMGKYIADFALHGHKFYNGKVLPVNVSTP